MKDKKGTYTWKFLPSVRGWRTEYFRVHRPWVMGKERKGLRLWWKFFALSGNSLLFTLFIKSISPTVFFSLTEHLFKYFSWDYFKIWYPWYSVLFTEYHYLLNILLHKYWIHTLIVMKVPVPQIHFKALFSYKTIWPTTNKIIG